jgi:siroheme synthase
LTYRSISQSFAVITAHCHEGQDQQWARYAHIDTLVVLMGVKNREFVAQSLIAAGRRAAEPVAFIERGTLPEEKIIESTLGAVAAGKTEIASPAVFVIGEVVRLRERLSANARSQQRPEFVGQALSGDR